MSGSAAPRCRKCRRGGHSRYDCWYNNKNGYQLQFNGAWCQVHAGRPHHEEWRPPPLDRSRNLGHRANYAPDPSTTRGVRGYAENRRGDRQKSAGWSHPPPTHHPTPNHNARSWNANRGSTGGHRANYAPGPSTTRGVRSADDRHQRTDQRRTDNHRQRSAGRQSGWVAGASRREHRDPPSAPVAFVGVTPPSDHPARAVAAGSESSTSVGSIDPGGSGSSGFVAIGSLITTTTLPTFLPNIKPT